VVHHFPHEVDVDHEGGAVALPEEVVHSQQAVLELWALCDAHDGCELGHGVGGLGLICGRLDGFDEKLQGRFLEDDGGVRSLRLG
jgi:hypothetical protein